MSIRDLIKRHTASLAELGAIRTVRIAGQGEQAREYYLNRKQAIYITAKSETPKATEITIEVIERFDAYERGVAGSAARLPALTPDDRSAVRGIIKRVVASQIRPLLQVREIDHAHIITLKRAMAAIKAASVAVPVERVAGGDYWPMFDIVKAVGIGREGRRKLVLRCGASMRKWSVKTGRREAVKITTDAASTKTEAA